MSPEYLVEKAAAGDADLWPQFARLHQEEITDGFLATFGGDCLALLYAALSRAPDAILFAAIDGGPDRKVLGFICGSTDTASVYRHVALHNALRFLPKVLPKILTWRALKKLGETLVYPAKKAPVPGLPKPEILNFCVTRRAQGRGVGRALFQALMREFSRRGVAACKIVTGASQEQARRFYASVKAIRIGALEVHAGEESVIFRYDIVSQGVDSSRTAGARDEASR